MKTLVLLFTILLTSTLISQTPQWQFMGLAGEEIYDIVIDDSGNVYVASETGVFKSTDSGASWSFKNNGLQVGTVNKLFIDYDGNIYLSGILFNPGYGLYKSTDGGENWFGFADTLNNNPINYFEDVTIIPNEPGGIIYVSNYYGVYRSTDNGVTWQSTNYSDPCARNIGINTNGYMFFGNACASWFGIYRSTNLGLNWVRHTFLGVSSMVYLRDGSIFASCYDSGLGSFGIYKTTNNGDTWFNTNTFTGLDVTTDFLLDTNDDIYASIGGQNPGIYLSTNTGNSWIDYGLSAQIANVVTCLANDTIGYIWAGAHQVGLYRAEGRTVPVELISFSAEAIGNTVLLKWITSTEINNLGFEIERQIGNTEWEKIGFVGGNGTTTEISNYSFNDEAVSNGIYNYRLKQIDFDGRYEYSKTVEVSFMKLTEFNLEQNYPNPFNPETNIDYIIPEETFVTISLSDVTGRVIIELVNEKKDAGTYTINFDGASLSSGIYFYTITAKNFHQTRKMLLVK